MEELGLSDQSVLPSQISCSLYCSSSWLCFIISNSICLCCIIFVLFLFCCSNVTAGKIASCFVTFSKKNISHHFMFQKSIYVCFLSNICELFICKRIHSLHWRSLNKIFHIRAHVWSYLPASRGQTVQQVQLKNAKNWSPIPRPIPPKTTKLNPCLREAKCGKLFHLYLSGLGSQGQNALPTFTTTL